jgi:hypothetical protein
VEDEVHNRLAAYRQLALLFSGAAAGLMAQQSGFGYRRLIAALDVTHSAARAAVGDNFYRTAVIAHEAKSLLRGGGPLQS